MIGSTIGKYRVVAQLGRGGMGTVYHAVDETLGRDVAVKLLNADLLSPESMQRFRAEAITLARLNHPRIAVIHELAREGDGFMMVMEYVGGETFERLMLRTGQLPVSRAVVLCDQVLDALEHAHAEGIVHRDLKPSNMMVTRSGDVKVMDFGIARVAGTEHLTTDGFMMGTPAYMPPEQVRGEEVDRRMDLYAVAVVLYRMLTGHLPFEADGPIALIHAQLNNPPAPPRQYRPDLPDWLDDVLTRGLAKLPHARFQSAAEFRLALERGLAGSLGKQPSVLDDQETILPMRTPTGQRAAPLDVHLTPKTTPAPTGAVPADATVTLRKPHLVAAGAFVLVLVIGVGVLAFVAFRRTATIAPVSIADNAAPIATPAAAPESPPPAAEPPVTAAASTPPPGATAGNAAAAQKIAPTPAIPPKSDQTAAARATAAGAPAPVVPVPVPAPAPVPTPTPPPAEAVGRTEPVSPPHPPATIAPESFGDVRTIMMDGGRSREVDALLNLESDRAILRSRDNGAVLQSVPYRSIAASTYTRARRPRGSEESGVAALPKDVGSSGFLMIKTSKHWLTLQSKDTVVVLRLEDKNVMAVLASLESRTGHKVQRVTDTDK